MSIKIMSQVWELAIPHNEQLVLLAMADHANDDGENIHPGLRYMAWKTGYSKSAVRRIIERLVKSELVIVRHENCGRGNANLYAVDLTKGVKKEPFIKGSVLELKGVKMKRKGSVATTPLPSKNHQSTIAIAVPAVEKFPLEAKQWNEICAVAGLPKVLAVSDDRKDHLRTRRKDSFWVENYESALQKIAASDFCRGGGNTKWVATFDWLVGQRGTLVKVMEGKYDNRSTVNIVNHRPFPQL